MHNILTLNHIAPVGLQQFSSEHYQVGPHIESPDAIILRSHDLHQFALPESVQIIGRAGAGTNNIPIAAMTERGIPVLNTPGANANAVKELVLAGMLIASRNICEAWDFARQLSGDDAAITKTVEASKKQFAGTELPGKTLAVVGLGNIGVLVANAAIELGMEVIGFDPAITVKHAWQMSASVTQADTLEEAIQQADFVTLHVPLIEATRHLINAQRLSLMKKSAVLLNFARHGIVDDQAVEQALSNEQLNRYVTDFPNRTLLNNPRVINLPHLGASTREAEENCAVMVARQIMSYLQNGEIKNSVNFPNVKLARSEGQRIAIVNANVPNMVAQITSLLSTAEINIIDMINKSRGEIAYTLLDVNSEVKPELLNQLQTIEGVIRLRVC